ncbi:MAG: Do family serine endopeptidase [Alphaproteobacteria bacterium]
MMESHHENAVRPLAGLVLAGAILAVGSFLGAPADARGAPESFADLVERLMPAVVNISSYRGEFEALESVGDYPMLPPGAPYGDYFGFYEDYGGEGSEDDGFGGLISLGSGFIIDPEGYVVTNAHVVDAADNVAVLLEDNTVLKAEIVGRDPKTDLALLKVDAGRELPSVAFGDSDAMRVGDWVIAIGNPFGLGNSVTAGIISARERDINVGPYDDFLQTDAPINRGNSGGPMFNVDGDVVGVNTLIFSPSGGSVGIGFATSSALAERVIEQLREYGRTRRGWLGVRIQSVSRAFAEERGLSELKGALVASVTDGGPAHLSEIEAGDVILEFDGIEVVTRRMLPRIVANTEIGEAVRVVLWRDGREMDVDVTIGELDESDRFAAFEPVPTGPEERIEVLGLALASMTPELRERFGIGADVGGVVVTERLDGESDDPELRPGDVIVSVAKKEVETPAEVSATIELLRGEGARTVLVLRYREGSEHFVTVDIAPS